MNSSQADGKRLEAPEFVGHVRRVKEHLGENPKIAIYDMAW